MNELSAQHKAEIVKYLQHGKKLEAIKYAREVFHISLKDSLRLVNTVDQELNPGKKININTFSQGGGLPRIFYFIFGSAGVVMVVWAGFLFIQDHSAAARSMKTKGEVVDFSSDEDVDYPIVKYMWNGDEYTYYGSVGSSPPSYDIGEEVEMLVDPGDPNRAMINNFEDRFFGITILGGLGSLFLGMLYIAHKAFGKSKLI